MPSEKILAQKQEVVRGLVDEIKSAQTIVLAQYLGLTVAQDTEMRTALREGGVTYKVVKNTMLERAVEEAGLPELKEHLVGPTALAYSTEDPVAPAKILKKFADQHPILEIKGGASEGKVVELSYLQQLASIPDLPVLYAKVVGGLVSPIAGLAMLLKAVADKMEEAGAETAAEVYEGPKAEEAEETEEATVEATEEAPAEDVEVKKDTEEAAPAADESEATEEA